MADFATLETIKDLLDDWDEEATRRENAAYRSECSTSEAARFESDLDKARAEKLRDCIAELGASFPDAKAWHEEGVVPADSPEEELIAVARDAVERWRAGKLDGSRAMHNLIWPAVENLTRAPGDRFDPNVPRTASEEAKAR